MKRSLLARLRSDGLYYLISALLLLLASPLYQIVVLAPTGFGAALSGTGEGRYAEYLNWISAHTTDFLLYRAILIIAFALLISFPFALYRIIVAQELLGQQELAALDEAEDEEDVEEQADQEVEHTTSDEDEVGADNMPAHAWRGKGFVVLAAWLSLAGLVIYVLSALVGTFYFVTVHNPTVSSVATFSSIFTLSANTVGTGLLGLGVLFFGAMIARTGRNLWPDIWVTFGYVALFVAALLCISAIGVVSAPGAAQSTLTSIATLLFAVWILWLGIMLVRLKPEA